MEKKVFGSIPVTECVDSGHKQSLFSDTSLKTISQLQFRFINTGAIFPKLSKNRLYNFFFNLITEYIVFGTHSRKAVSIDNNRTLFWSYMDNLKQWRYKLLNARGNF